MRLLMLTKYVLYSRQFNAHTICVENETFQCSQNMCCTADSLMPTQYVQYSRKFKSHIICAVQQTV